MGKDTKKPKSINGASLIAIELDEAIKTVIVGQSASQIAERHQSKILSMADVHRALQDYGDSYLAQNLNTRIPVTYCAECKAPIYSRTEYVCSAECQKKYNETKHGVIARVSRQLYLKEFLGALICVATYIDWLATIVESGDVLLLKQSIAPSSARYTPKTPWNVHMTTGVEFFFSMDSRSIAKRPCAYDVLPEDLLVKLDHVLTHKTVNTLARRAEKSDLVKATCDNCHGSNAGYFQDLINEGWVQTAELAALCPKCAREIER